MGIKTSVKCKVAWVIVSCPKPEAVQQTETPEQRLVSGTNDSVTWTSVLLQKVRPCLYLREEPELSRPSAVRKSATSLLPRCLIKL